MPKTYAIAIMKFIDVTALKDAKEKTEDNEQFGNMELLKEEIEQKDYATLELNRFTLDGKKEIMQENQVDDVVFWSNNKSEYSRYFESNPVITVDFGTVHTSSGITLYFADDYPEELKITWYSLTGDKLKEGFFYPDDLIYFCKKKCANYGKIKIEFIKTRFPDQYIKMQYILYGQYLQWKDDIVINAKITEDIDVTSATLSINKCDISIIDEKDDFNIEVSDGNWESVQKTQEIRIQEYVNGKIIECGLFYLDTWSFAYPVAKFSLTDAIGYIDRYTFKEGKIYNGVKAGEIIDGIFAAAEFEKYEIDQEIYDIPIYGYLPIQSCRAALQQICFAIGAVADDSHKDTIRIYKPLRYVNHSVDITRKFSGKTVVALDEYVTGVSVEYNSYVLDKDKSEIVKDAEVSEGETEIQFTTPIDPETIALSSGTAILVKTNYCIIDMLTAGTITITAKKYTPTTNKYVLAMKDWKAGEKENVKNYGTLTVRSESYAEKAKELLRYFELQKNVKMSYLLEGENVGNWLTIFDTSHTMSVTLLEKQSINLSGGYIATATCRGYSKVVTDYKYTGTELYTGGMGLI